MLNGVLERCNFVWILNDGVRDDASRYVLERCNFVWILNDFYYGSLYQTVLERCNFVWIQNRFPLFPLGSPHTGRVS